MRRMILFLIPLLITTGAVTAQAPQGDLVCTTVTLEGSLSATAGEFRAWFRPTEAEDAAQLAGFRLAAATMNITEYGYAMATRTSTAGVPLTDNRLPASTDTYSHDQATVRLLQSHPSAEIRVVSASEPTSATFAFDTAYDMYANRSQAAAWEDSSSTQYTDGTHPEAEEFFVVPGQHLILSGSAGALTANGTLGLWMHGFDIQVTEADGSTTTYNGHPENQGTDAGPLEAEAESWADYLIRIDGEAHLDVSWDGPSTLFSPTFSIEGEGHLVATQAYGVMAAPEEAQEYAGTDAVLQGDVAVTAHHDAAPSGDRIALDVAPQTASAPPAAAPTDTVFAGLGWFALSGILVAFLGTGVAAPVALRAWQRRTPPPMPPRPIDAAPHLDSEAAGKRISHLLDEGDGETVVPLLQKEVRKQPKNAELRYALGVAYGQAGNTARALVHLDYALRQDHAFLGMLVTDPRTQSFRHDAPVARMVRRAARRFQDEAHRGYA